ncbi:hypothetical protein IWX50DRAFT_135240 [Phyllosticta citricarpa]
MRDDFVIEALLSWIYKDELEPEEIYSATRAERATNFPRGNPAERQLRGYMLLWAAAEMFGVAGLKVDIWDQIRWDEVFTETPGRRDSLISLAIAFNILQDLYIATQDVPRGICARYLALRWVSEHSADLFRTPQFYDRALEHVPEFWCELRQFKTDEMERTRECPSCKAHWTTEMVDDLVYRCWSCLGHHSVDEWTHSVRDRHQRALPTGIPR